MLFFIPHAFFFIRETSEKNKYMVEGMETRFYYKKSICHNQKKNYHTIIPFWCWRGDSNSQAEAYAPQAYVYTNSTTPAYEIDNWINKVV